MIMPLHQYPQRKVTTGRPATGTKMTNQQTSLALTSPSKTHQCHSIIHDKSEPTYCMPTTSLFLSGPEVGNLLSVKGHQILGSSFAIQNCHLINQPAIDLMDFQSYLQGPMQGQPRGVCGPYWVCGWMFPTSGLGPSLSFNVFTHYHNHLTDGEQSTKGKVVVQLT